MERNTWMYEINRISVEYLKGVDEFIECAVRGMRLNNESKVLCPCIDCQNILRFDNVAFVKDHLVRRGFKKGYTRWTLHGESDENINVVDTSDTLNLDENVGADLGTDDLGDELGDDLGDDLGDELGDDLDDDELGDDLDEDELGDENIEADLGTNVATEFGDNSDDENINMTCNVELDEMMNDMDDNYFREKLAEHNQIELFPGCTKFSKLSAVFQLYNLKAKNGWSDVSFTSLLEVLKDMLPENNVLPDSTYKAKKLLCPLIMEVERIHACRNDCILYRNEYENLDKCPKCDVSRYKPRGDLITTGKKGVAVKTVYYLPIIPRFRRLFANSRDAKLLRWHVDGRKSDGKLRHPADSPDWRNIDTMFPNFGSEPRNLRLGLCTDGMNPYGNMSSRHTTWPVLLCVYNFPPWLCMKRKYIMMPLLISGPKQPGNDIDVYLAPLIEDLGILWRDGVDVFDAHSKSHFNLRAMIFCTINDFPAYGNLSGYKNKGAKACPICGESTHSIRLHFGNKNVYLGHRKFLDLDHPYRRNKKKFDGKVEKGMAPMPLSGREVFDVVKTIKVQFGKKFAGSLPKGVWKKQSIFWSLEYWKHLEVRHCLDGMHIVKNICESIVGTLLNIPSKTKDNINARKDMAALGIRLELAPQDKGDGKIWLPAGKINLSKDEKNSLLECLKSVKVPSGYSSNISSKVSIKEMKLIGMKSHDYHVLLTQLLPVAIRGILEEPVRRAITKLCFFFNSICSKVIDIATLDQLQIDVVQTLCDFESVFPPAFFDIMVHLTVHLVREIKMCGPIFLRYMYPFERAMGQLKGLARSRSRPEGSIVEGYIAEEVIEFYTDHMERLKPIGIPVSRHEGRLDGKGTIGHRKYQPSFEMREKAHLKVLQHLAIVAPYVNEHLNELRRKYPLKLQTWIDREHDLTFVRWFKQRIQSQTNNEINDTLYWLSLGPSRDVQTWQGYDLNGFTWYTKQQDNKSTMQNSGVTIVALSGGKLTPYYGQIEEIWELDYMKLNIALFRCNWVEERAVKTDKYGFTIVDLGRLGFRHDPFILANKQAMQVFYIPDPTNNKLHVVLHSKRRIVGVGDVVDEEEYDHFDEIPPFSTGIEEVETQTIYTQNYHLRSDHQEGVLIQEKIIKPKKRKGKSKR